MSLKNTLIIGYPGSGRFSLVMNKITKEENISSVRFEKTVDILKLSYRDDIDDIKDRVSYFTLNHPIELKNKYCVVEDIDFCNLEKQELFLKYLEDTPFIFFFTACYINNIKSKALVSRLAIEVHSIEDCYNSLSDILKRVYFDIKDDFQYLSMSHIDVWYLVHIEIKKMLTFKSDYMDFKNSAIKKLKEFDKYPLIYSLEIIYDFTIRLLKEKYKENFGMISLFNKLIRIYSRSNLLELNNFSLFVDSAYLIYISSMKVKDLQRDV